MAGRDRQRVKVHFVGVCKNLVYVCACRIALQLKLGAPAEKCGRRPGQEHGHVVRLTSFSLLSDGMYERIQCGHVWLARVREAPIEGPIPGGRVPEERSRRGVAALCRSVTAPPLRRVVVSSCFEATPAPVLCLCTADTT
ncbi:unnamed protein product [Leptosia nina]|uniref:Uncharacterized protein n=1 Tax=Leptosia nina TaxID=320188 RepID=A0AAV1JJJ2_9NEOP